MIPNDLREYIGLLEAAGQLCRVEVEVDPYLELAAIVDQARTVAGGGAALLFTKVRNCALQVVVNLFANQQRLGMTLGRAGLGELPAALRADLAATGELSPDAALACVAGAPAWLPEQTAEPAWRPTSADLRLLPNITAWPGDGGPYLTLAQVYTRDPESGVLNCGMYRVQLHGKRQATIRFRAGSDGAGHLAAWHARDAPMPVAVVLGGPPLLSWLAAAPLPGAVSEVAFAGYLCRRPLTVSRCRHSDLVVPASAEVVIEGVIRPRARHIEGPFGNHTGRYDQPGTAPLMEVVAVHCREGALIPWTLVGSPPRENVAMARAAADILLPLVQMTVPGVRQLHMPDEGIFHRVAFVTLAPWEERPLTELARLLWSTQLLKGSKLLVLGADDHDPGDAAAVFWRVLNRADWSRDLLQEAGCLALDARRIGGEPLRTDSDVRAKVLANWERYGIVPRG